MSDDMNPQLALWDVVNDPRLTTRDDLIKMIDELRDAVANCPSRYILVTNAITRRMGVFGWDEITDNMPLGLRAALEGKRLE